jgi:FKBP-type peptidyl-prolyl cis-trans isomerase FkpA
MTGSLKRLLAMAAMMCVAGAAGAAGLAKTDTVVGKGKEAVAGKTVEVNYTGWLHDPAAKGKRGKQFDSSVGRGPFSFPLGAGRVIKGWDEGVAGMKVGGKRTLVIPPELGYGAQGAGGVIPPNATLVFDVELLDVK